MKAPEVNSSDEQTMEAPVRHEHNSGEPQRAVQSQTVRRFQLRLPSATESPTDTPRRGLMIPARQHQVNSDQSLNVHDSRQRNLDAHCSRHQVTRHALDEACRIAEELNHRIFQEESGMRKKVKTPLVKPLRDPQ